MQLYNSQSQFYSTPISYKQFQLPRIPGHAYRRLPTHLRTIKRAYGGSRCHECVRNRYVLMSFLFSLIFLGSFICGGLTTLFSVVRAFLIEEHKIVKRVKSQGRKKVAPK